MPGSIDPFGDTDKTELLPRDPQPEEPPEHHVPVPTNHGHSAVTSSSMHLSVPASSGRAHVPTNSGFPAVPTNPGLTHGHAVVPTIPGLTHGHAVVPTNPGLTPGHTVVPTNPGLTPGHTAVPFNPGFTHEHAVVPTNLGLTPGHAAVPTNPGVPSNAGFTPLATHPGNTHVHTDSGYKPTPSNAGLTPVPTNPGLPNEPPPTINILKRKMSIAKGCLDIGLLSANANQLRNVLNFGNRDSSLYYVVLVSIIISLILQVSAGVLLLISEKFDLEDDNEVDIGDILNSVTTILVFVVLILNVFIASLGVDIASPSAHVGHEMLQTFPGFT
ncbi:hypothetical protein SK128_016755 [Halocaridina rubra]|uniref:Uncharacterized protein n=1 Tax=Halocaridina rubra TaxID=373956 RepID=A0AAN8XJ60_HALRR